MTFYTLKPLKRVIKRVWEPFLRMFLSPFFGVGFLGELNLGSTIKIYYDNLLKLYALTSIRRAIARV